MLPCVVRFLGQSRPAAPSRPRLVVGSQPQLLNQTVRSQRSLTIMFRQSSGKYDCHGWTTERTLPSLAICLAISIALSERYTCGTANIGTRGEVSKFIVRSPCMLRECGQQFYAGWRDSTTRVAP